MPNHLIHENSPYLLQHANNPVDWYPWGEEALQRSRDEHKPIFLSIGYAACHWCHVMAHESFEDPQTAAIMNDHFVCIKVDREERPDLDSIYMAATQALTGSGGWPMSVFLTPDLRPFYAGTYFPPVRRHNMPSFKELLSSLAEAWREQSGEVERVSMKVLEYLQAATTASASGAALSREDLDAITRALLDSYDWGYGGWGSAPKFPQPMLIEFLLRQGVSEPVGNANALKAALHALNAMARGGMYDVVGGGFARYSTDNFWRVPHFEKMLYDNAQLARVYLHAWKITGEPLYKRIAVETFEFARREMMDADGGFYSSIDADSEGEEGKYYAWTADQIRACLLDSPDFDLFSAAYGLTDRGNWEGKTVLQRALDDASLSARFKMSEQEILASLARCHAQLRLERNLRVRPGTDDKILTAWNGLMLESLAEAARFIDDQRLQSEYLQVATRSADFLLAHLQANGRLHRIYRAGKISGNGYLEDYAALILGLLALYQADFNDRWFISACRLADEMLDSFRDPSGGFYDTAASAQPLLYRPKDVQDNATPSGNALACEALLKIAALTGRADYRDAAERSLGVAADTIRRFPTAFGRWLSAADFALSEGKQVALLYPGTRDSLQSFREVIDAKYRPNLVVAASAYPPSNDAPPLLADRMPLGMKPTAYVCENFVCKLPVDTPQELRDQL